MLPSRELCTNTEGIPRNIDIANGSLCDSTAGAGEHVKNTRSSWTPLIQFDSFSRHKVKTLRMFCDFNELRSVTGKSIDICLDFRSGIQPLERRIILSILAAVNQVSLIWVPAGHLGVVGNEKVYIYIYMLARKDLESSFNGRESVVGYPPLLL